MVIKNWKDVADHLGISQQFINWVDRPRIESPTEKLLMDWEVKVASERPEDALANLQEILHKIGRNDAANKIQVYLEELSTGEESLV